VLGYIVSRHIEGLVNDMVDIAPAIIEVEELPEEFREDNRIESTDRLIYGGYYFHKIDEKCVTSEYVLSVFVKNYFDNLKELNKDKVMLYRSAKKEAFPAKRTVVTRTRYILCVPETDVIYINFMNKRCDDLTLKGLKIWNFFRKDGYSLMSFEFERIEELMYEPFVLNVCRGGSVSKMYCANIDKVLSLSGQLNERLKNEVNLEFVGRGDFINKFKQTRNVAVPVICHLVLEEQQKFIYIPLVYGDLTYFKDMRSDGNFEITDVNSRKTLYSLEICGLVDATNRMGLSDSADIQLDVTVVEDTVVY